MLSNHFEPFRTLAIGDIHGGWSHLIKLLGFVNYKAGNDRLIFLGDYVDRGDNSKEVLDLLIDLKQKDVNTICLMGNHEDLMLSNILENGRHSRSLWFSNGCDATLKSFGLTLFGNLNTIELKYINFLQSLKQIYIDEELKMVFVHGGIDPRRPVYDQDLLNIYRGPMWIRMDFFNNPDPAPGYKVIFGHTPTYNIQRDLDGVFWDKNKIGIDTGLCYGHKLTALEIIKNQPLKAYSVDSNFKTSIEIQPH